MQNAADIVILTKVSIKLNPFICISCDRGNKKGNKNLAKYACWYCKQDKRVKTYLLDVDCTDGNTDDITNTLKHSLKRVFGDHLVIQ